MKRTVLSSVSAHAAGKKGSIISIKNNEAVKSHFSFPVVRGLKKYFWLFTSFFFHFASAQLPPDKLVQSPNAASLGTFGSVPVSYFTGTPDISFPIYTVSYGSIKVPITLRYHQAMVKPNEHPGWVGLGWALETAGTITRKPNGGACDEVLSVSDERSYNDNGKYSIASSTWDKPDSLYKYYTSHNGYLGDYEADEFSFNFLEYSGKFFMTSSGWQVISDKDVKVQVDSYLDANMTDETQFSQFHKFMLSIPYSFNQTYSRQYFQFTLTTEDGTQYIFGGYDANNTQAIEYSVDYDVANADPNYPLHGYNVNTWHLVKIIDANQHSISFSYYRPPQPICRLGFYSSDFYQSCNTETSWSFFGVGLPTLINGSSFSETNVSTNKHGGTAIFPVYLSQIVGANEVVNFTAVNSNEKSYTPLYFKYSYEDGVDNPNAGNTPVIAPWLPKDNNLGYVDPTQIQWQQLNEIQVMDKSQNPNLKKDFLFSYSSQTTQRLTLNSFTENLSGQMWTFNYNNIASLPDYGGDSTDHWGYYNGTSVNSSPGNGISFYMLQTLKNTNPSLVTTGLLTQVTYPTGGYTQYDWEPHQYSSVVSTSRTAIEGVNTSIGDNGYAGGSRIQEIRSYASATATPVKRHYYYLQNYAGNPTGLASSGVLNGRPQYDFSVSNWPFGYSGAEGTATYDLQSVNNSVEYSDYGEGSPIGYTEVAEQNSDGSYTKYQYTSYGTDVNGVPHWDRPPANTIGWVQGASAAPFIRLSSLEQERGKLLSVTHYNSSNSPVRKTSYTYNSDPNRFNSYIRRVELRNLIGCTNYSALLLVSAFYEYTYRYNVVSETTTDYNADLTAVNTTKTYTYNAYGLVSGTTVSKSDGSILQKLYQYPTDYDNSAFLSSCSNTYNTCNTAANNNYSQCVANCAGSQPCQSGCAAAQSGELGVCNSNYNNCLNQGSPVYGIVSLAGRHVLSTVIEEQDRIVYPDNTTALLGGTLTLYQNNSTNVLPYQVYHLETSAPTANLQLSGVDPSNGGLDYHPNYVLRQLFDSYDGVGNILQYHRVGGVNQSYIWGYNKTFPVAAAVNAGANEIFFDGFESAQGWDANLTFDGTINRGGTYSGSIINTSSGTLSSYSTQTINPYEASPTLFKYSGWVYSNGPGAGISLVYSNGGTSPSYTVADNITMAAVGQWTYIEKEFAVPSGSRNLTLRLDNNGIGTVWFDDLRIRPSAAQMVTYTFDVVNGVTSRTDQNNNTVFYEYDNAGRLKVVRDQDNKIIKQYQYHYQGQ